jgi:hypothetical protein
VADTSSLRAFIDKEVEIMNVFVGPAKEPSSKKIECCGDPKKLDGNAHPWVMVSEDGPGDVYRCPVCGAVDVD